MKFKLLSYARHKEQGIEGLVINPNSNKCSHVTIYDPECPNDDDFSEESYSSGSVLEFNYDDMEEIKNPSKELIDKCKNVANQFKKKYSKLVFFRF